MLSRVLFAYSNPGVRERVSQAFASEQIDLIWAEDGEIAKGLLDGAKPDLLIAEFSLPGLTGFELCQYAKESAHLRHVPVVLLDGQFDLMNQAVAHGAEADAYIAGPLEEGALVEVARRLLDGEADDRQPALAAPAGREDLSSGGAQALCAEVACEEGDWFDERAYAPDPEPYAQPGERALEAIRGEQILARPAQQRSRDKRLFWATLVAILMAALGILTWQPSRNEEARPEVIRPEITLLSPPVEQSQTAAGLAPSLTDGSNPLVGNSDHKAAATDALVPDGSDGQDDAEPPTGKAIVTTSASETRDADSARAAPPSTSELQPSATDGIDSRDQPVTRARRVRYARASESGNHMTRAGRELKLAGKHMGSGIKHFGQGTVQGAKWSGKKLGRGFSRVGKALKSPF